MRKRIENKMTMFKTVYTLCSQNMAIISSIAGLNNTFTEFVALLAIVIPVAQTQILNNKGITKNKKQARLDLVEALFTASGRLMSRFSRLHDHEIYDKVSLTEARMKAMRDMKLLTHAQTVIDLLTNNQAELASYHVDAAYIASVEAVRDVYSNKLAMPTVASNEKKAATSDLDVDVHMIDAFLKESLDTAMRMVKETEPNFYKRYLNARKTLNTGIKHEHTKGTLKGIVKDAETHQIISDALIEFINTPTMIVTNELGEFTIEGIPPGTYSIKISAGNYEIKTIENIIIVAKQVTPIEINLTPAA
ncbi:MAG: carboxypeptidase-like regulatory domain-containing protein [Chitinophagales bacterium]